MTIDYFNSVIVPSLIVLSLIYAKLFIQRSYDCQNSLMPSYRYWDSADRFWDVVANYRELHESYALSVDVVDNWRNNLYGNHFDDNLWVLVGYVVYSLIDMNHITYYSRY